MCTSILVPFMFENLNRRLKGYLAIVDGVGAKDTNKGLEPRRIARQERVTNMWSAHE